MSVIELPYESSRYLLQEAETLFSSWTLDKLEILGKGYRPFGSERVYENLTYDPPNNTDHAIYEYCHITKDNYKDFPVDASDDWNWHCSQLFPSVMAYANQQLEMYEGVPNLTKVVLRLLHYPPQATPKGVGLHLDFDYITVNLGEIIHDGCTDSYGIPQRHYWFGEQMQLDIGVKADVHTGRWFNDKSRYALIAFCLPPQDYVLKQAEMTSLDYICQTVEKARVK